MTNISLITIWNDVLDSFPNINKQLSTALYDNIIMTYSSDDRIYHNTKHLTHMFTTLFKLFDIYEFNTMQKNACILATFFHDIVYNVKHPNIPTPKSNEELSAEYAYDNLVNIGINDYTLIDHISTLIKLTTTHKIDTSCDIDPLLQSVFLDSDMAIMGEESFLYEQYSDGIKEEYSEIEPELYIAGRKNFLSKLSKVKAIFLTEYMNQLYNDQVHHNIETEIKSLNSWYVDILTSTEGM